MDSLSLGDWGTASRYGGLKAMSSLATRGRVELRDRPTRVMVRQLHLAELPAGLERVGKVALARASVAAARKKGKGL
jgi:hypothetical protein